MTPSNVTLFGEKVRQVLPVGDFDVWLNKKDLVDELFVGLELYPKYKPTERFVVIDVHFSARVHGIELKAICMLIGSRTQKFPDDVTVETLDMNGLYSNTRDGRLFWPNLRMKAEKYESTEEDVLQYLTSSHQEIREYGARLLAKLPSLKS
jgi:hypothetical protein